MYEWSRINMIGVLCAQASGFFQVCTEESKYFSNYT